MVLPSRIPLVQEGMGYRGTNRIDHQKLNQLSNCFCYQYANKCYSHYTASQNHQNYATLCKPNTVRLEIRCAIQRLYLIKMIFIAGKGTGTIHTSCYTILLSTTSPGIHADGSPSSPGFQSLFIWYIIHSSLLFAEGESGMQEKDTCSSNR